MAIGEEVKILFYEETSLLGTPRDTYMKALEPCVLLHTGSVVGQLWQATLPGTSVSKLWLYQETLFVGYNERYVKKTLETDMSICMGPALSQHPSLAAARLRGLMNINSCFNFKLSKCIGVLYEYSHAAW